MASKIIQYLFVMAILGMIGIYINTDTTCQINISGSVHVLSKISNDIHPTLLNQKDLSPTQKYELKERTVNFADGKLSKT